MVMVAESYLLKLDLPYSEYWLPLLIGMGVGLCALTCGKVAFGRKSVVPHTKSPPAKHSNAFQTSDYDPFTQGSPNERRKSYRRQGNPTDVFIARPGEKEQPARGWVLDRSMGGISLKVSEEVQPGTQLSVLAVNAPPMTLWVDVEVRSCHAVRDSFELGCQFIKTPSWSILLTLG